MRSVTATASALLGLLLVSGCDSRISPTAIAGSGRLQTESRNVSGFSSIIVSAAAHLIVERTGVESLQVTADDNVLPYLQIDVFDGRLILGIKPGTQLTSPSPIVFRITVRDLTDVVASGASQVDASGIETPRMAVKLSGASTLHASGTADDLFVTISGASRCDGSGIRVRKATAYVSGTSYALLRVVDDLFASVSGLSTVEYLGSPAVRSDVAFGSTLTKVGD